MGCSIKWPLLYSWNQHFLSSTCGRVSLFWLPRLSTMDNAAMADYNCPTQQLQLIKEYWHSLKTGKVHRGMKWLLNNTNKTLKHTSRAHNGKHAHWPEDIWKPRKYERITLPCFTSMLGYSVQISMGLLIDSFFSSLQAILRSAMMTDRWCLDIMGNFSTPRLLWL